MTPIHYDVTTHLLPRLQNVKGKADNRARILAWLDQLDNQVKMADENNILLVNNPASSIYCYC